MLGALNLTGPHCLKKLGSINFIIPYMYCKLSRTLSVFSTTISSAYFKWKCNISGGFGFVRCKWIRHLLLSKIALQIRKKKRILGYANTNMLTNFRSHGNSSRQQGFHILRVRVSQILWVELALLRINKMCWHTLHASDYMSV